MTDETDKPGFASLLAMNYDQRQALQDQQPTDGELEADLFGENLGPRGRGRPPGALNKRTKSLADLIAATGQSPGMFLASIMRDVTQPIERRKSAAEALLPYCHSKLPVAVDLHAQGGVLLRIDLGAEFESQPLGAGGEPQKPSLLDVDAKEVKSE